MYAGPEDNSKIPAILDKDGQRDRQLSIPVRHIKQAANYDPIRCKCRVRP